MIECYKRDLSILECEVMDKWDVFTELSHAFDRPIADKCEDLEKLSKELKTLDSEADAAHLYYKFRTLKKCLEMSIIDTLDDERRKDNIATYMKVEATLEWMCDDTVEGWVRGYV